MNPAWNRLGLAGALALAGFTCPVLPASAAEPASAFPTLRLFDDAEDGMWWHIHKVSPQHPLQRDGSETGCVAIADYVQSVANQMRPADAHCPVEVVRDRAGSAELRARCTPAPSAQGGAAVPAADGQIRYTLKRNGSEIQLSAEQGPYRYSSRFLRVGDCDS